MSKEKRKIATAIINVVVRIGYDQSQVKDKSKKEVGKYLRRIMSKEYLKCLVD